MKMVFISCINVMYCRSQWPLGLRRRSAAARLLRSWVRIPPGAWMSVCCECCVLSGRGLCDELISRPEESYRLWCVVVCDLESTKILVNEEEAKSHWGASVPREKKNVMHWRVSLKFSLTLSEKTHQWVYVLAWDRREATIKPDLKAVGFNGVSD